MTIGAYRVTSDDLCFRSADDKTVVCFSSDGGKLQVSMNGYWLWLSPKEVKQILQWLHRNFGK